MNNVGMNLGYSINYLQNSTKKISQSPEQITQTATQPKQELSFKSSSNVIKKAPAVVLTGALGYAAIKNSKTEKNIGPKLSDLGISIENITKPNGIVHEWGSIELDINGKKCTIFPNDAEFDSMKIINKDKDSIDEILMNTLIDYKKSGLNRKTYEKEKKNPGIPSDFLSTSHKNIDVNKKLEIVAKKAEDNRKFEQHLSTNKFDRFLDKLFPSRVWNRIAREEYAKEHGKGGVREYWEAYNNYDKKWPVDNYSDEFMG